MRTSPYRLRLWLGLCVAGVLGCDGKAVTQIRGDDTAPGGSSGPSVSGATGAEGGTTFGPGHVAIHRLTNDEYNHTVQDLLFTTARPGDAFPPTSVGSSGFRNDSEILVVTPGWMTRYYESAEALATAMIATKSTAGGAYSKIATCPSGTTGAACAQAVVERFATRAFRRPSGGELTALMTVFNSQPTFDEGLRDTVIAVLLSPRFLYNWIDNPAATDPAAYYPLSNHEMASRLSYFLWQTMPDDELLAAAQAGQLVDPAGIEAQVRRMLKDPRALRLAKTLRNEWAGLAALESSSVAGLSETLRAAMLRETDLFLNDLIQNDRSFLNVVAGGYSFVNQELATHYGLGATGAAAGTFTRVTFSDARHAGLVTQSSVLTATAGGTDYTHPVRRGLWATQRVLCAEPPPPPAEIPIISFDPSAGDLSIRERLKVHTASPACSGCHKAMDAIGLGLENFDPFGRWRATYPGKPQAIDATGTLPGGQAFANPSEMYSQLATAPAVRECLTQQLLSLALTRVVRGPADLAAVRELSTQMAIDKPFSAVISAIAQSAPFRQQAGEAP